MVNKNTNLELLKNFALFGKKKALLSLIDDYELYRDTVEVPGDIVIVGYNIALPLLKFANFTESRIIGDRTRMVYGVEEIKAELLKPYYATTTQYKKECDESIKIFDQDRFVPWKARIKLVRGDIVKEVRNLFLKVSGVKISLLYFYNLPARPCNEVNEYLKEKLIKNARVVRRN